MTERKRKLQFNPGPLKVTPEGKGLHEAFKPLPFTPRCEHEDGRGQCSRIDTRKVTDANGMHEWLCPKHAPEG